MHFGVVKLARRGSRVLGQELEVAGVRRRQAGGLRPAARHDVLDHRTARSIATTRHRVRREHDTEAVYFELLKKVNERRHFRVVVDATRWNKLKAVWMVLQVLWILLRTRPHVVVSTGAADRSCSIPKIRIVWT